jgi:hypothetical protein
MSGPDYKRLLGLISELTSTENNDKKEMIAAIAHLTLRVSHLYDTLSQEYQDIRILQGQELNDQSRLSAQEAKQRQDEINLAKATEIAKGAAADVMKLKRFDEQLQNLALLTSELRSTGHVNLVHATPQSRRMDLLQAQINVLSGAITSISKDLDQQEDEIHLFGQDMLDVDAVVENNVKALKDVFNFEKTQQVLDTMEGVVDAISAGVDAAVAAKDQVKSWTEWIPELGGVSSAIEDFIGSGVETVGTGAETFEATKILVMAKKGIKVAKFVNTQASTVAKLVGNMGTIKEDVMTHPWVKGAITASMLSGLERARDINNKEAYLDNKLHPTYTYLMEPLRGSELSKALTDSVYSSWPGFLRDAMQNSNIIPAHGYVVMVFPVTELERRVVIVSISGQDTLPGIAAGIVNLVPSGSIIAFEATAEKRATVNDKWQVVGNKSIDGSILKIRQVMLDGARTVKRGAVNLDYNLTIEFLKCMETSDIVPYNLLRHNCQSISQEVIGFIEDGDFPHWWGTACSASLLHAIATDKHNPNSVNGEAVVTHPRFGGSHINTVLRVSPPAKTTPFGTQGDGQNQLARARTQASLHSASFTALLATV